MVVASVNGPLKAYLIFDLILIAISSSETFWIVEKFVVVSTAADERSVFRSFGISNDDDDVDCDVNVDALEAVLGGAGLLFSWLSF